MKKAHSAICGLDFYVTTDPNPPHQKDGLAVLSPQDVSNMGANVNELGRAGVAMVLRRKARGTPVDQAIWDFLHFHNKKRAIPEAAVEFFSWVENHLKPKVERDSCENMQKSILNRIQRSRAS